ncbi:MAG: hydroxymethylglutaryl-CoA synthase [Dehalococcoidia bacterium]|nr:hydroxymethylglutaryl-CoA synthase [Dehalococcoidia bacterium]
MPAGITAYGAYIPIYRLERRLISDAWGTPPMPGERAVANHDEDSITMAVAAAIDSLNGIDREKIDGLYLATTTSPYKEKQAAATIATAVDLRRDVVIADFTGSLRAGTAALRSALDAVNAGSAKQVIVVAADNRLGSPQTPFEQNFGDGAAAFVIGDKEIVAAIEGSYNIYEEFIDLWRRDGDRFVKWWEDRFIVSEGYTRNIRDVVSGLLQKHSLTPADFAKVVYYAPDMRSHGAMARTLGFDAKTQVQEPLFATVGNSGAAFAMMMLVAALEESKPGDRILFVCYGDGADAFILRVTNQIEKIKASRRGIKGHLPSKKMLPSYTKYMNFRRLIATEPGPGVPDFSTVSRMWRDYPSTLRLHGTKCKNCGHIQFPIEHVCVFCQARDNYEEVRLSDKRGEVFTYTADETWPTPDPPLFQGHVNFDGGGRINIEFTDLVRDEMKVGLPVEMTFRKMHEGAGFYNYYWKARPVR